MVTPPTSRMPHTIGTPANTLSRIAEAVHLAATSKIFSSAPDQASNCSVATLKRVARYSSGEMMPSRCRRRGQRGAKKMVPMTQAAVIDSAHHT